MSGAARPVALLLATGTMWVGPARFARSLALAGFEVALLAPRGALAGYSRHLHKLAHVPDGASAAQWVHALAATVQAVDPAILLPADDTAFRLLATAHAEPPPGMTEDRHAALSARIADSLGDPAHYLDSVDKTRLPLVAAQLGVRVPPFRVIAGAAEGEPFITEHGFPVVLKRRHSTAGAGVEICADLAAYEAACASLLRPQAEALPAAGTPRLMLQKAIRGRRKFHPGLAWRGALQMGWAAEVLEALSAKGPGAVTRQHHDPLAYEQVALLARGLGLHGIFGVEFLVEDGTGLPYVVEINRRISPGFHRGTDIGADLGIALREMLSGATVSTRRRLDDTESHRTVSFPQEWLRDPHSAHLREEAVDVPWDDPALIRAFLAMRHQA